MKVVRLSTLHRADLFPSRYSWYSFLLQTESNPGLKCGQEDYVNPVTKSSIELATFLLLAQCPTNCVNAYPLFYQNDIKYRKHVGNTRKGQRLHTDFRFESVNDTTMKVKVKILYVRLKTYTNISNLFIRA